MAAATGTAGSPAGTPSCRPPRRPLRLAPSSSASGAPSERLGAALTPPQRPAPSEPPSGRREQQRQPWAGKERNPRPSPPATTLPTSMVSARRQEAVWRPAAPSSRLGMTLRQHRARRWARGGRQGAGRSCSGGGAEAARSAAAPPSLPGPAPAPAADPVKYYKHREAMVAEEYVKVAEAKVSGLRLLRDGACTARRPRLRAEPRPSAAALLTGLRARVRPGCRRS